MVEKVTDQCYRGFIREEGIEGSWQITYSENCADAYELELLGSEDRKIFIDFKNKEEMLEWLLELKTAITLIDKE